MMNEYIGDDITEKLHEEQWLSQLQETAHGGTERAASSHTSSSSSSSEQQQYRLELGSVAGPQQLMQADKRSDRRRLAYATVWSQ